MAQGGLRFGSPLVFASSLVLAVAFPTFAGGGMQPGGESVPIKGYAGTPPHYIGTLYCEVCHEEQTLEFADTVMGKLFLEKPVDPISKLGCEGCHGPGSNHAASGGGVGVGDLVAFREGPQQPIARANQACLVCHDEAYWHGETHGMRPIACFDCHTIMLRESPHSQLSTPLLGGWNKGRMWRNAAEAGLLFGALGAIGRIFSRRRRRTSERAR